MEVVAVREEVKSAKKQRDISLKENRFKRDFLKLNQQRIMLKDNIGNVQRIK